MEIEELPSIIYQLLLFSSKGQQDRLLKGIVDQFNKLDMKFKRSDRYLSHYENSRSSSQNIQQLRLVEGTVILHIDLAIKRDQVSSLTS